MTEMAVSPVDNGHPDAHARPAKNRQFSLYANRIKPDDPDPVEPPPLPAMVPVLPRWDSLQNGPHLMAVSPTSESFPRDVFYDAPEQSSRSPISPTFREEFPRMPLDDPLPSPNRIVSGKSSNNDMRQSSGSVGNFSRPRKPSIKQPIHPRAVAPRQPSPDHIGSPWFPPRSRAPSNASVTSTYTFASPLLANAFDSSAPPSPRLRTAPQPSIHGPPGSASAPTSTRPTFPTYNRVDTSVSASPGPASGSGGGAPWASGDELRSSFRSQLTSSTAPGTTVTERSSVMTKDSSVSSLYATADANADAEPDEPSIEDVMGMYERGFKDDTDNEDDATDSDDLPHLHRQLTTLSETGPAVARFQDVDSPHPPRPVACPAPTTLDAEIRQSKLLFSSPAFTSMLPAVTGDNMTIKEEEIPHNRDSAKSIGSGASVASRPATSDFKETLPVSPIADTDSQPNSISPTPAPAPTLSYAEMEEPGARDRYGFKKQNQSITREQYDDWNKNYSQYLARRRRKWVAYLKDNALMTDRPLRFPPPNAKTKRFVRKGIPPDWRGAAWFYYAGGPAILSKHSGLYEKLLNAHAKQIDVDAIERDLHRTFPDNVQFKPSPNGFDGSASTSERQSQSTLTSNDTSSECSARAVPGEPPIITSLRRVLHAFSIYNPRIGYCQSLNFLAGLLLLFVETEEQCFWLLNVITHIYLPGTHEMSLEGSKVDLGVLMAEIRDTMPEVWDRIGGELEEQTNFKPAPTRSLRRPLGRSRHRGHPSLSTERLPPITLCMTAWFMSCFIGTLPIETTLRVWDVFFYEGSKTLFRVALAIFKHGEAEIKSILDPMEMFGVVQALPRKMLDANLLMEQCFKKRNGFNHLNQNAIDDKRRERRDKTKKDREQIQHSQTMHSGNVTETETAKASLVRRPTLFGKKKRVAPEL
ncbi:GTPase-activating protein gyp3 [Cordyceps javanica]|uniref:GTPase-activating protein gyp3 n=1 Tax=Cordyceps javanica TaxID=43265 RepID=A0A545UW75_9HYPO|nr:GTPase-activating protein gyp3 [Cordyceps javanica]TQW04506.1 GTPase-activating protein gyp3 [Cordyceps javanica]